MSNIVVAASNPSVLSCKLCGFVGHLIHYKGRFAVVCTNRLCDNAKYEGPGAYGYQLAYFQWNRRNM